MSTVGKKKCLCSCNKVKQFEIVRLLWGRSYILKNLHLQEAGGDYPHLEKVKWGKSGGRFEDAVLEDWSDVATNQGMPAATRWWRGKGRILPKSLQWKGNPTNTLIPVQQYWLKNSVLPNLGGGGGRRYTVGHHACVIYYSSHRKLIQGRKKPRSMLSQLLAKHSKRGGIWTWPWGNWRRQWHPTPVLLPGKSHGWRSLVGCSPWGR